MDFEKLKKAALETFKMVSSKKHETPDADKPEDIPDEPESVSAEEEKEYDMGTTQRIELKNVLDIFKKKKFTDDEEEDTAPADVADTAEPEAVPETAAESEPAPEAKPEPCAAPQAEKEPSAAFGKSIDELKQALDALDAKLDAAADKEKSDISDLNNSIAGLSESISQLHIMYADDNAKRGNVSDAILLQLSDADEKLKNISTSVSGVAKLGDSIFDLKNSQMNTKNSLGDLESSFYKLKKKMSTSIVIMSILTAIIAILEIINLLS